MMYTRENGVVDALHGFGERLARLRENLAGGGGGRGADCKRNEAKTVAARCEILDW